MCKYFRPHPGETDTTVPLISVARPVITLEQHLRHIAHGLEERLSRLVAAWKPRWRTYHNKIPAQAKGNGLCDQDGAGKGAGHVHAAEKRKKSRRDPISEAGDPRTKLRDSILELLLDVVDRGVDLQVR